MRLFSIDFSFSTINFSLFEEESLKILYAQKLEKKLLDELPDIFLKLSIDFRKIDVLATSVGVGYSTPLKIGITFIKTIAYSLKKPLYTYENLFLMGKFSEKEGILMPCLTVGNQRVCSIIENKKEIIKPAVYSKDIFESFEDKAYILEKKEDFFFSYYGGLYTLERIKNNQEPPDIFEIEPIYVRGPARESYNIVR